MLGSRGDPKPFTAAEPARRGETAFMERTFALAARGRGRVEPNPMVGCVLVRGSEIVGEGYHRRFGGPHAEVEAIRAAGPAARGATAYVTLEPCCHHGKTPPCTDALLAAGIKRLVAAMRDPFEKVRGRGLAILRRAGVRVNVGLCEQQALRLNGPYIKRQKLGLPWVILKWAQSIDGKIATRTGDSKWISGERSRRWAHQLRGRVDAIVVGVGTVVADDPLLTRRHGRPRRVATRIVLDPRLRTPRRSQLVQTARSVPTIIVTSNAVTRTRKQPFTQAGIEVLGVRTRRNGLDLRALLVELARRGMTNVLVEGGGRTLGTFYDAGLADEAVVFVSRRLIGGAASPCALGGWGPSEMKHVPWPVDVRLTRCGQDDVYQILLAPTPAI
ncbi:MAG: bifunctional diaminohydroxyphosphoribosylaminopyrimidine deaminase/5-amino-6-(5-phosphoribosylamino)uracil reductase RibD [Planctomycetes bacterium]|nr:bifunctional diaminohydroxyphosphoribosylaminopyrimidine deaminase/5-amino-6-(5-phosphoribosylamino)uracil reductase RibD [Planctomycetota bacterium]